MSARALETSLPGSASVGGCVCADVMSVRDTSELARPHRMCVGGGGWKCGVWVCACGFMCMSAFMGAWHAGVRESLHAAHGCALTHDER